MRVVPVPVRSDNYAYLIIDESTNKATAVDPYDVEKVSAAVDKLGVQIIAGLTTHHHHDHSGGNKEFASKYPDIPMYGGSSQSPALTQIVKDKDEFNLGDNIAVRCLATPCHTQDSICYHVTDKQKPGDAGGVFTGDTLFIGGCGRFFEGNADEMDAALSYLGTLPDKTVVYNGHEYTAGNVAFAKTIEPESSAIAKLENLAKTNQVTTGLTTIAEEKEWNVFMRLDSPTVRKATNVGTDESKSKVMAALREGKNNFRGHL
ncbi:Metallo-hydrolase/oxidoreductase [Dendrothele bispora CBS 962.96]|uniref:hydroxyacylglutathione hydrolase n=1 Tax=Dendrothele bispora (strain CBS 962.96) TaxID=1314807 RepID=A0A4S8MZ99_DENBC|nr:Metallo-hydrolase/oxidoreductase [Dendrothele bispora CBS 962.96]